MDQLAMSHSVLLMMPQYADRLLFGDVLEHDGFATTRTESPPAAREEVERSEPEIVMIALDEDFDQAISLIDWLRGRGPANCRIVGVTANPMAARKARQRGADRCLQLPLPMRQVVTTLQDLIQ